MVRALYFPHLSVPDAAWMNSALLFFDQIGVIVPEGAGREELLNSRTDYLMGAKVVLPFYPREFIAGSEKTEDALIEYIVKTTSNDDRHERSSRVHMGKIIFSNIFQKLAREDLAELDGMWMLASEAVTRKVMSYLAMRIATSSHMDLVTGSGRSWEVLVGSGAAGTRIQEAHIASALLSVRGDIDPHELVKFRDKYERELQKFRWIVQKLSVSADSHDAVKTALECRNELQGALNDWSLAGAASRLVLVGSAAAASFLEASPLSGAVGIAVLGDTIFRELRDASSHDRALHRPLAYAALAMNKFGEIR